MIVAFSMNMFWILFALYSKYIELKENMTTKCSLYLAVFIIGKWELNFLVLI